MEGGDGEFAKFTLPTLKTFLEARSQNVSTSCYRMPHELAIFWSAKNTAQRHFFSTLHPLSPVIFATATVVAFVLLRNSRFNFHCHTQHNAYSGIGPEVTLRPLAVSCAKDYKGYLLVQTSFTEPPNNNGIYYQMYRHSEN